MADMTRTVNPSGGADHTSINAAIAYIIANWTPSGSDKAYVEVTGNDTTQVNVTSAPTGQTSANTITVRPASGQRHAGTYSTSKARLTLAPSYGSYLVIVNATTWITFEGMQFENTATSGNAPRMFGLTVGGSGKVLFKECLGRFTGSGMPVYPGDTSAVVVNVTSSNTAEVELRNCIFWNGSCGYRRGGYSGTPGTIRIRNCTFYNFAASGGDPVIYGSDHDGGAFDVTNTFVHVNDAGTCYNLAAYTGTLTTTGFATSDATSPNVSLRSKTPTFVNAGSFDLHLQSSDTALKDAGTDMAGTYATDIDGGTFGVRNDIGAHELAAGGGGASVAVVQGRGTNRGFQYTR